jgi:hypothetical protein
MLRPRTVHPKVRHGRNPTGPSRLTGLLGARPTPTPRCEVEPISIEHAETVDDVDQQSLHGMWERLARNAPDRTLFLCALAGALGPVVIALVDAKWWTLAAPLFAAGGFGGWGIADREAARRIEAGVVPPRTLHLLRGACMAVGAIGLAVTGLVAMFVAILRPLGVGFWR